MQTYKFTNLTSLAKISILLVSRIIMFPILFLTYINGNMSSCSLLVDIYFVCFYGNFRAYDKLLAMTMRMLKPLVLLRHLAPILRILTS